jgi:predicted dehydrogenase
MERFRVGIIGAGHIAEKMAWTLTQMTEAEPYAVASRSLEKAEAFAEKYGFSKAYGSYEDILDDPMVELVYVATPHSFHHAHVRMCLEKGKPVLCEKAFMLNRAQAEDVINLAREKKVFLAEAIWTRYEPAREILDGLIASGEIGTPTFLKASLSYPVEGKERVRTAALGGGALLDLGVYALNFARMYFGTDIVRTVSNCHIGPTGMDMHECISLSYADGKMANLQSGALCLNDRQGIISGTEGYIRIDNINCPECIEVWRNYELAERITRQESMVNGYEYQVIECKRCIENGLLESPMMPHKETIDIMKQMDSLRKEWGVTYPMDQQ